MFFLSHFCQSLSLSGSHSPPHLLSPPTLCWSLDLLWGQLRFWSGPTLVYSCLQCPQLSELVHFLLWEFSMSFYIFHRCRVWLVDHVDLIFILYSWWEGFGFSSLATLTLGFKCGFISTSTCGSSTGICSWGCPGGLRSALWGPGVEVVQLLDHSGFSSTRYSGELVARAAGNIVL